MKPTGKTALIFLLIGSIVCIYYHSLVIIRWPWHHTQNKLHHHAIKKPVILHYWHHGSWLTEKNNLIMSNDTSQSVAYLINTWLTFLDEEKIMNKKVELQTAAISPTGHELFLSFDRSPFDLQQSIYEKWMWIESLLKTIKAYDATIDHVRILVRHKPLHDMHLDFSNPWPIHGFLHH